MKIPQKTGASRKLLLTPRSNPKASVREYPVASGNTAAASIDAPNSPTAKTALAYGPTNGTKARAASSASVTEMWGTNKVAPVQMMMKPAIRFEIIEPV